MTAPHPPSHDAPVDHLVITLLRIDAAGCRRCDGTADNIAEALRRLAPALEALETTVTFDTVAVATAADAERHRLPASPTVRINGIDIAPAVRETPCSDCAEACDCADDCAVECREWFWRGETFSAAPVGLLVEAVLRAALGSRSAPPAGDYRVPESLAGYFASLRRGTPEPCCGDTQTTTCC